MPPALYLYLNYEFTHITVRYSTRHTLQGAFQYTDLYTGEFPGSHYMHYHYNSTDHSHRSQLLPTYRYTNTVYCEITRSYIKITSPKEKSVLYERTHIVPYTLHALACKAPVKSIFSAVFVLYCASNAKPLPGKS